MLKKKYVLVLALAFCVTAALFVVAGTGYDPWIDYDDDGYIGSADAGVLNKEYGTSGDPTKNVTIVGHASKRISVAVGVTIPAAGSWTSPYISIDGYAKVTVLVYMTPGGYNEYQLRAYNTDWGYWIADVFVNFAHDYVKTYDVMNQGIRIWLSNNHAGTPVTITVDVYLMA